MKKIILIIVSIACIFFISLFIYTIDTRKIIHGVSWINKHKMVYDLKRRGLYDKFDGIYFFNDLKH